MNNFVKILLVEDNPGDVIIITEYLKMQAEAVFEIVDVDTIVKAKKYVQETKFDVIILDLNLPDSNGLDTFYQIKSIASSCAIIVSTGVNDLEFGKKAIKEGAHDYLVKNSITPEILYRAIFYAIARRDDKSRINHLYKVLRALHEINQLITHEDNIENLIEKVCKIATHSNGYNSAYIFLVDENIKLKKWVSSGFGENIYKFIKKFKDGIIPECIIRSLDSNFVMKTECSKTECKDCPLHEEEELKGAYTSLLSHKTKIFGFVGVSLPIELLHDEEEKRLFIELAEDLSFALYSIELQNEEKRLREIATENEKKFRLSFNNSAVAMGITNKTGNFISINNSACKMFNFNRKELLENNFLKIIYEDDKVVIREHFFNCIETHEPTTFEARFYTRAEELKTCLTTISPISNSNGDFLYAIVHLQDITDRKIAEKELIRQKQRAEKANKAKTIFLSNMSHELRTPLIAILGFSEMFMEVYEDYGDEFVMAEGIYKAGQRLLSTLSLILDISRIESENYEILTNVFDAVEELNEIYKKFKLQIDESKIKFSLLTHSSSQLINTDREVFKVIIENLLSNAIKFTLDGKIEIKTEIAGINENMYFNVIINDSGIGMAQADLAIIFDDFKQLSEGTTKEYPGSGLGLSLTKRLLNMLDAVIDVKSEPGKGSTFTVGFKIQQQNIIQ